MPNFSKEWFDNYERQRAIKNHGLPQNPKPECVVQHGALASSGGEEKNTARITVSVTSFRQRLLDADNLIPKYFIDGLRYAGLIPGDNPQSIQLEQVKQVKVKEKSEERTEIVIEMEK